MAVELMTLDDAYICLSTDTKPANPAKDLLYEVDTGIWYAWSGAAWVIFTGAGNLNDLSVISTRSYGVSPDQTASYNQGALDDALAELVADDDKAVLSLDWVGTVDIDDWLTLNACESKTIRGRSMFATKIRQTVTDKGVFDLPDVATKYLKFTDFELLWTDQQTVAQTSAYGISFSMPGTDTNATFGHFFDNIRMQKGFRGIGIRKSSGAATVWDIQAGKLVFIDMHQPLYFVNPAGSVGQPESHFRDVYIQASGITTTLPALHVSGVEALFDNFGLEDWTNAGVLIAQSKEQVRFGNFHAERHNWTTVNKALIQASSTGPIKIGDLGVEGTINMAGASDDGYIILPGGGYVDVDTLYTTITNTQGLLSVVASGAGSRVRIKNHRATSGTVSLRPSWDTGAKLLVEEYGKWGGVSGYADFVAKLQTIAGDIRLLWMPDLDNTTSTTDKSLNGRTITWDATVASRLSALGKGYQQSFNGTDQAGFAPDAADLTFTSGALSMIVLANVTDTAAARTMIGKWRSSASTREYQFGIDATDHLQLAFYDESIDITATRTSDAVITQGAPTLFGVTCTDVTGATVMNNTTVYENGLAKASTAANGGGTFAAMEDLGNTLGIGSIQVAGALAQPFSGSMALAMICTKSLTASDHWAIKNLINSFFGLSL